MIRQCDVMLVPVEVIPASAQTVERDNGRVILAYGEVTGHAHAILEPSVEKLADGIAEYLCAPSGAIIEHEEHAAITIDPGNYRIIHQREYASGEIKRVRD